MAAGNTFSQIASTTLGSASLTVDFSSIPSTYTDLRLIVSNVTTASAADSVYLYFNVDGTSNYSNTILKGNGTTAASVRQTSTSAGIFCFGYDTGTSTTNPAQVACDILNYANTTTYKTALSRGDLASAETNTSVGLWRSTSAINAIRVRSTTYNFKVGTVFSLYGITAA